MSRAPIRSFPALLLVACAAAGAAPEDVPRAEAAPASELAPFALTVPHCATRIEMRPVPGGTVDGELVSPFWISATEVPWEAYDALIHAPADEVDAASRPSRPYITMDRGFGHEGYPALSVSFRGAQAFCAWLGERSGRALRVPTVAEWRLACERGCVDAGTLDERAWYAANSGGRTHPVGSKRADALGVHDLAGNVAEWARRADGRAVVLGGSWADGAGAVGCGAERVASEAWNASDPQIPRSVWWLADAGFVGLRVVCGAEPADGR